MQRALLLLLQQHAARHLEEVRVRHHQRDLRLGLVAAAVATAGAAHHRRQLELGAELPERVRLYDGLRLRRHVCRHIGHQVHDVVVVQQAVQDQGNFDLRVLRIFLCSIHSITC